MFTNIKNILKCVYGKCKVINMVCNLLLVVLYLGFGLGSVSAPNCLDSAGRPGSCLSLSRCPNLIEEFYEQVRRFQGGIDFQSFVSQSVCGFDGFNFLICCTIRPNSFENQQPRQPTSSLLYFASLGNPVDTSGTTANPFIVAPVPFPQTTPQTPAIVPNEPLPPIIVSPVPGGSSTFPDGQQVIITPSPIPTVGPNSGFQSYEPLPSSAPIQSLPPFTPTVYHKNDECGISYTATNRVVGGTPARRGAYPWMAALGYYEPADPTNIKFYCAGSLISSSYVLTSAHCINPSLITVRLGAHDLSKKETTAIDIQIRRKVVHEKFDLKTIANDIALLQLDETVVFTKLIRPICLPEDIKFIQQNFNGNNPFIAGWGSLQFQGAVSSVLREGQVPIIDTKTCMDNYSTVFKAVESFDTIICAGTYKVDACQGDSGGPLMMPLSEGRIFRYYLIGLVSYGYECARAGFPGVYTRVAAYIQWIKNNMI